jgi:hypothetical protein
MSTSPPPADEAKHIEQDAQKLLAKAKAIECAAVSAAHMAQKALTSAKSHDASAAAGRGGDAATALASARIEFKAALDALEMQPGDPLDEWKECRSSIGRFDSLLVDLRKTGFGFVVALVSAVALLLARLGPAGTSSASATPPSIGDPHLIGAIYALVALLIFTLYAIDRVHGIWLAQSVERARELEGQLHFELTERISVRVSATKAAWIRGIVYLVLSLLVAGIFWFASNPTAPWLELSGVRYFVGGFLLLGVIVAIGIERIKSA